MTEFLLPPCSAEPGAALGVAEFGPEFMKAQIASKVLTFFK